MICRALVSFVGDDTMVMLSENFQIFECLRMLTFLKHSSLNVFEKFDFSIFEFDLR